MRVYATDVAEASAQLAGWGLRVVMDQFAEAGVPVEHVGDPAEVDELPDVWLLSMPYAGNAYMLRPFFDALGVPIDRRARGRRPLVILGGHAVVNPDPWLDIADAVFVGEADDQAQAIARALPDVAALAEVPGVATEPGRPVTFQIAGGLDKRGVYYSPGDPERGVGEVRYLEVARGCKAACRFCELGWLYGYDERSREETDRLMLEAAGGDAAAARSVVLSAPDTDGVGWLNQAIVDGDYDPRWRSTRIVPYLRSREVHASGRRGRIRFGVEGVTPRLRKLVGKYMSDEQLEDAVQRAVREGYRNLRMFVIGGLPTEDRYDRRHLRELVAIYRRAGLRHWKAGDIKVTGLSPQPMTPWQRLGLWRTIEAMDDYRRVQRAEAARDPQWKAVMPDAQSTEADVVKRMGPGELLAYLDHRPAGLDVTQAVAAQQRWKRVREWAEAVGIDYRARVLDDRDLRDALPWDHVQHPLRFRQLQGEAKAWLDIQRHERRE